MENIENDDLWDLAMEHWDSISMCYERFQEHRPIVLFDVQEVRIYVYPYAEFQADLKERNRKSLAAQYATAKQEGKFVLFVRDNDRRKLCSYSIPDRWQPNSSTE